MQIVSADPVLDLAGRLKVVVDDNAEPSDLDATVATFLLKYVSKRRSAEPAAELSISNTGDERLCHVTIRG